jgi:imidazolonepropionase-like amidohydrolase
MPTTHRPFPAAAVAAAIIGIAAATPARAQAPAAQAAAQDTTALSPSVRQYVSVAAPVVALTDVRVVDGTGKPPAEGQTILVEGGRIKAVGPAKSVKVPKGARVMSLAGHTVLPGLVGLHNHTWYTTSNRATQLPYSAPRLYLGSGVTTIRTTGSLSPYVEMNMKHMVEKGELVGPRMHITGPYITGANTSMRMYNVKDSADARRVVAYWAEEGATWFKIYTRISRAELAAAVDEAHKRGLKVTGHLCSVGFREAVAIGIDNLEHGLFVNTEYDPNKKPDECPEGEGVLRELDLASEPVQQTFRDMIAKKIPMTSTLAVYELFVPNRPPLEERVLEAMSPDVRTEYLATRARIAEREGFGIPPEVFRKAQQFEVAFVRAGGTLAAGVDPTGNGGALPGYGDQRNYELLIEAGFTPVEVVRIMSLNGAAVLGMDKDLGSIEAGKIADLVVIQGDPIAKPAEIRQVVTVFKDGIGYDSKKLLDAVKGQVGVR